MPAVSKHHVMQVVGKLRERHITEQARKIECAAYQAGSGKQEGALFSVPVLFPQIP